MSTYDPILITASQERLGSHLSPSTVCISKRSKDIDSRSVTVEEAMKGVDDRTSSNNLNACLEIPTAMSPSVKVAQQLLPQTDDQHPTYGPWMHVARRSQNSLSSKHDIAKKQLNVNTPVYGLRYSALHLDNVDDSVTVGDSGTRLTYIVPSASTQCNIKTVGRSPRKAAVVKDSIEKLNIVRSSGVVHEVLNSIKSGNHTTIEISDTSVDVPKIAAHIGSKVQNKVATEKVNRSLMLSKGLDKKGAHLAKVVGPRKSSPLTLGDFILPHSKVLTVRGKSTQGAPVASIPSAYTAKALDSIQWLSNNTFEDIPEDSSHA
ncbi:hypothetical protein V6N12_044257 [Hibiscus sabdariffa]|uniref:Uncharacterized protein n=1 Tax=Hibiscus sabdariffa TaxID=183260 RepID=A0ABR2DGQ5_9ROSI